LILTYPSTQHKLKNRIREAENIITFLRFISLKKKHGENQVLALARARARVFICCVGYKFPVHTTKWYKGTGVIAPLIRNLGNRWKLSGLPRAPVALPSGEETTTTTELEAGRFGEDHRGGVGGSYIN